MFVNGISLKHTRLVDVTRKGTSAARTEFSLNPV
jgi:hypothetical protein